MVRVIAKPSSDTMAQGFVNHFRTWLTNAQTWEVEANDPPKEVTGEDVSVPHYRASWWFDWSEDPSVLLDTITQYSESYCDWVVIGWHECSHSDTDPTPCPMQFGRDGEQHGAVIGAVPASVDPR